MFNPPTLWRPAWRASLIILISNSIQCKHLRHRLLPARQAVSFPDSLTLAWDADGRGGGGLERMRGSVLFRLVLGPMGAAVVSENSNEVDFMRLRDSSR